MRQARVIAALALGACVAQPAASPQQSVAPASRAPFVGVGYAPISSQPGGDPVQKRLMAIRASRMAAMRDLAEQIYGLKVEGSSTSVDSRLQGDSFRTSVRGIVSGARTVRIGPKGADSYETVLEVDRTAVVSIGPAR